MFASLLAFFNRLRDGKIAPAAGSFYDFTMNTISGQAIPFSKLKGKKVLVVNTASQCGYTPQLDSLEKLHRQSGDHVTVLAFPSNDFLGQEPGTNAEIETFCTLKYNTTFPIFEKIRVRGRDAHPLYKWLGGKTGVMPGWNFWKYLVDEKGEVIAFFDQRVDPLDKKLTDKLR